MSTGIVESLRNKEKAINGLGVYYTPAARHLATCTAPHMGQAMSRVGAMPASKDFSENWKMKQIFVKKKKIRDGRGMDALECVLEL